MNSPKPIRFEHGGSLARCLILLLALLTSNVARVAGQTTLRHTKPTFTLTIPRGFERLLTNQLPGTLYSFAEPINGNNPRLNFSLQDMRGIFAPTTLRVDEIPKKFRLGETEVVDRQFHQFALSVVISRFQVANLRLVSFTIQIPLRDGGLQANVTGPIDREKEARQLLEDLLNSLQGDLFDPSKQISTLEFARLLDDGKKRLASISNHRIVEDSRFEKVMSGKKTIGWSSDEIATGLDSRSSLRTSFEWIHHTEGSLLTQGFTRQQWGYIETTPKYTLLAAEINAAIRIPSKGTKQGTKKFVCDGETVSSTESVSGRPDKEHDIPLKGAGVVESHSFIESLQLKAGDRLAYFAFNFKVEREEIRLARADLTKKGELRIDIYNLNGNLEKSLDSQYWFDANGTIRASNYPQRRIKAVRVEEKELIQLQRKFPRVVM